MSAISPRRQKPASPGRPKDPGKRQAILEAAQALFLREGFGGVSMDRIAAEAGVSKLTVYSHFGDKESLFGESIRLTSEKILPSEMFGAGARGSLRERLFDIARSFFAAVTSSESLAMNRILLQPGQSVDPGLREAFWNAGPQRIHDAFNAFLRLHVDAGELAIADLDRASRQFFCLIKGDLHMLMVCGLTCEPSAADIEAHITASVDLFLRAYAPR